jgi:hypothetical protein
LSGSADLFNRHFSRAALLGRALLFIFTITSAANAQQPSQPTKLDVLLAFFYKDPQPERLVGIFTSLQSQSSQWGAYPPVAGLFAGLFKLHPDWIERLTPGSPDPKAASTLVAALRLSGQSAKADLLRARFANVGLDQRLEAEFARLPSRIEDLQISTPTHLDLLWGASFAGGDGRYVRPIIDFLANVTNDSELVALDVAKIAVGIGGGPNDVLKGLKDKVGETRARQMIYAGVALWAISANARQHAFVKQTTTKYIQEHPGTPATKALSALTGTK